MNEIPLIISVIVATLFIVTIIMVLVLRRKGTQLKLEASNDSANFRNEWYNGISKQIYKLKSTLSEKDYKKFKLDLLLNIAQRIAEFCSECGQCMLFQQEITTLVSDVANLVQIDDKEKRKTYFKSVNKIIGHLQRQHKLVTEGYYIGICMAMGSGIGVALGAAMEHISFGIPIGVCIGLAIGAALDAKAKKEGRILYTRDTVGSSKTVLAVIIGLGLLVLIGFALFILSSRNI